MIDPDGTEWLTYAEAAQHFPQVKASTLRSWVHRGVIHPEDVKRWKGRVTGIRRDAIARAEVDLYRHGPKLAAGVRRGAGGVRRRDVQQFLS
jgi:hypothetical protein